MKYFVLLVLTVINLSFAFGQDLPNYMTDYEKSLNLNYNPQIFNIDDLNSPPTPVRTMAEWEELQGIMITWTSYTSILAQIVDYAQDEGLVYIVCSDSNSVKSTLTGAGVPLVNLKFLITSFNSVWSRDYGAWCAYSNICDSLKLIDWIYNRPSRPLDDAVPVFLANYLGLPIHQAISAPNNFIATGGNFMVDGHGTGFSSKLILTENPTHTPAEIDTIVKKYNGLKRYIKMDVLPYDGIHHIDMHMKMLDEETILVGQYPTGVSDGPQIELNIQYILNNFQTFANRPYKIVRIPMPPSSTGQYPPSSSYYTYTNATFVNKTVIVPIYGFSQDTTALRIYRENLPGYRVVGINCSSMISASGAIHCINKEIGVTNPVFISHSALRNTSNTTTPYEVKAYIKSKAGIANAKLFWRTDTLSAYTQVSMTTNLDTFKANIPNKPLGTDVYYYISATSNSSKTITKPLTAPTGYIKFKVTNATGITNTGTDLFSYQLFQNYPNPFNPTTKIRYYLRENGFVSLNVYDAAGRKVTSLTNENQSSGMKEVSFSAENLSSGIYFYKIVSNGWTETKKMLLVR